MPAHSGVDPLDLAEAMRSLQWRLRRRAGAEVGDLGVTPAQGRLIRVLGRSQQPPRMGELADRLHIAPRSVTDLVDPLVQAGLLRREQDPGNRRSWQVQLTEAGLAVHSELRRRSLLAAASAFEVLDAQERATLLELVNRIEAALGD